MLVINGMSLAFYLYMLLSNPFRTQQFTATSAIVSLSRRKHLGCLWPILLLRFFEWADVHLSHDRSHNLSTLMTKSPSKVKKSELLLLTRQANNQINSSCESWADYTGPEFIKIKMHSAKDPLNRKGSLLGILSNLH